MLTERFDTALQFAAELHRTQTRKGVPIPYLGHLLAVTALVIEDGGSEDEAIAALLHDSLEDQGDAYPGGRAALRASILAKFGKGVAEIVDACTDDAGFPKTTGLTPDKERQNWLERKQKYIEGITHKSPQSLRVTTADKVHNVESILDAHAKEGTQVWSRFRTKSRQDQLDVYEGLLEAIEQRSATITPDEKGNLPVRFRRAVEFLKKLT